MSKSGKVWGMTELVEANGALEFHRIEMNKGGVCSKHLHEFKWNGFFCESGRLLIRVWQNDYDLVDETILEAGDNIDTDSITTSTITTITIDDE